MLFQPLGGEIARISDDVNAITARHAEVDVPLHRRVGDARGERGGARLGQGMGRADRAVQDRRRAATFRADTGDEYVRRSFGEAKYARLVALKDKYDPDNLFRLNQNIKPSASA